MIKNQSKKQFIKNTLESIALAGVIFASSSLGGCKTMPEGSFPEESWVGNEYNLKDTKKVNFFGNTSRSHDSESANRGEAGILRRYTQINPSNLTDKEIKYFKDFNDYLNDNGLSEKEMRWIRKNYTFISPDPDPKKWPVPDKIFVMQEIYRVKQGKKITNENAFSYKGAFTP